MKIKVVVWINDQAHEYLMNLVAQGYFAEAQEFIVRLTDAFNKSLYIITGNILK